MRKYGYVWIVLMFAAIALAMAPTVYAAGETSQGAGSQTSSGPSSGQMPSGQASDQMSSGQTGDQMQSGQSSGMTQQAGSDYNQRFHSTVRGSQLIGKEVVNRNDEQLGEVEDLVIGRDGRVNYLVVSHGGVLGIGDNLIPVPFSAVDREGGGEERIILNVSQEELQNAPSFAQNEWPDFSDQSYEENVRGYYGTTGSEGGMESQGQMEQSGQMAPSGQESGTPMKEDQSEPKTQSQ